MEYPSFLSPSVPPALNNLSRAARRSFYCTATTSISEWGEKGRQLPRLAKTKTDSSPDPRGFMQGKCIPIYEVHKYVCLFLTLNSNHSPLLVTVICSLSPTETWQNKFTIIWWSSIYVGTDVIFKSSKGSRIKMWLQKQVDSEFLHWPSSGWMESWSQLKDCQILAKFP